MFIQDGLRKAGNAIKSKPVASALLGSGALLGAVSALQNMNRQEQEMVLDIAAEQEEQGGGRVLGLSSGQIIGAAAMLAILDPDFIGTDDVLQDEREPMAVIVDDNGGEKTNNIRRRAR